MISLHVFMEFGKYLLSTVMQWRGLAKHFKRLVNMKTYRQEKTTSRCTLFQHNTVSLVLLNIILKIELCKRRYARNSQRRKPRRFFKMTDDNADGYEIDNNKVKSIEQEMKVIGKVSVSYYNAF